MMINVENFPGTFGRRGNFFLIVAILDIVPSYFKFIQRKPVFCLNSFTQKHLAPKMINISTMSQQIIQKKMGYEYNI